MPKRVSKKIATEKITTLIEVAWEVCNQVGGIYTVIRSKAPAMADHVNGPFCLVGPYIGKSIQAELDPLDDV